MFAQDIDWTKLDVTTFSWQKVLGGEAQHGMLILSPRAVDRLDSFMPPWPLPKLFHLTRNGRLMDDLFEGSTINTPSMLCLELSLRARLRGQLGRGSKAPSPAPTPTPKSLPLGSRARRGSILSRAPETRSNTSACLKIIDPDVLALLESLRTDVPRRIAALLDAENVAKGHRVPPLGAARPAHLELAPRWSRAMSKRRCRGSTGPSRK